MTFKKSYVPGILGSVLTLTVIMAAPVKAETKEETILNKTDWSTMAAANVEGYVNIRSEANADSEIVGVLMPGYAVTVTEKGDEWSKISSNGVEGYIKNEYLVFGEETKAACKYLKDAYQKYGNWLCVAAAYNAGQGRISTQLQKQMVDQAVDLWLVEETL